MSKVSGMKCPYCGAPLPVGRRRTAQCEFCGSSVTIESQDSIPGAELADEINKLLRPLDDLNQTKATLKELQSKVKAAEKNLRESDGTNKVLMYVLPIISFVFLRWLEASFLASFIVALVIFSFYWVRITGRKKNLQSAYSSYKEKMATTADHLNELYETYNFDLVPEEYQRNEAMAFFVKVLNSGRAASLQQAITLYEEELHKKKLLKLQEEQNALKQQEIEIQRQQLKDQQEFNAKKLELAQQKKGVDWGAVAAAAGSVAVAAITLKRKKK